jgi:hypothetical protein
MILPLKGVVRLRSIYLLALVLITSILLPAKPAVADDNSDRDLAIAVRTILSLELPPDVKRDLLRDLLRDDCRQQPQQQQLYQPAYQPPPPGYQQPPPPDYGYGQLQQGQSPPYGQPQWGQPMAMTPPPGTIAVGPPHYDYRPPLIGYGQPAYGPPGSLGPLVVYDQPNTRGWIRQVSPNYYKIDPYPSPPRGTRGTRVLQPWVEGQTGVTLHLGP